MSEGKERAQARLENLEAIEPLLGSLRVLSLSTMQMAQNRLESLELYSERFTIIAAQLAQLAKPELSQPKANEAEEYKPRQVKRVLAVLGSSRGIAGQYNRQLARQARLVVDENESVPYTILAFGKRVQTSLTQEKVTFQANEALNTGSMPNYDQASKQIREWMHALKDGKLTSVDVLSFKRQSGSNDYLPMVTRLLPQEDLVTASGISMELPFPEPIIEGEPKALLSRISDHLVAIQFYELILQAIAAENLFRYRLLEEAKENTSGLLEELRQSIQVERRKEITQQLQELLVGSGMLAER